MKILQINAVYKILSTGRTSKEISDFIWSEGDQCMTIYGEKKGAYNHTIYLGNSFSHKIHAIISRLMGAYGYGSIIDTLKLLKYIKSYNPDIIHLRNLHANFINIPILLKFLAKNDIPTIVTLHDCYFFTGGCMHYTTNRCYKWKINCKHCQFLHRGSDFLFCNRSSRNLSNKVKLFNAIPRLGVIGVSDWIMNEAKQSRVFYNAKLFDRVYNWIDLDKFIPQGQVKDLETKIKIGAQGKFMILGVSSSWDNKKGLDDFLKLSELLKTNQIIVLVGKMPKIKLPLNIITIKSTNNVDELAELYSAADVFVNFSLEETFGKVSAEALGCGTPIIVYNSTASPELVGERCGYIIDEAHDVGNVMNAIGTISHRSKSFYSFNCREMALTSFNKRTNIAQQYKIYKDLIKN